MRPVFAFAIAVSAGIAPAGCGSSGDKKPAGALLEAGKTVNVKVTPAAGTYPFRCAYHPDQMTGTITVS